MRQKALEHETGMPYHFEFDEKHRILLIVVEGEYSDEDQLQINSDIRTHATALNVAAGIGDMSAITSCTVTPAAIQIAARESSPYEPSTKRFLVAASDHMFGISRMYQQTVVEKSRSQIQVVRSRAEALAALGVSEEEVVFEAVALTPQDCVARNVM